MAGTVREIAQTLLQFAETRTRLAANELEEQSLRLTEIVLWAAAALFLFAIALLFGCITLLLIFWDSDRLLAAGVVAGVLLGAALVSALVARRRLKERPKLLAATIEELAKDRERMTSTDAKD